MPSFNNMLACHLYGASYSARVKVSLDNAAFVQDWDSDAAYVQDWDSFSYNVRVQQLAGAISAAAYYSCLEVRRSTVARLTTGLALAVGNT